MTDSQIIEVLERFVEFVSAAVNMGAVETPIAFRAELKIAQAALREDRRDERVAPDAAPNIAPPEQVQCGCREALEQAYAVMCHFGDVLNGMDCVAEVEKDTGVSNDWVDGVFAQVRAALERCKGGE